MRFQVRDECENIVAGPDYRKTGPGAIRLEGGHQEAALPLHHGTKEEAEVVRGADVHLVLGLWPRIHNHQVLLVLLKPGCSHPTLLKDSL